VRWLVAASIIVIACAPSSAGAGQDVEVTASCAPIDAPGRVLCDVEARAPASGPKLRWADVAILDAAPFLTPLKGRLAPSDAAAHDASTWHFRFALVARDKGEGDVKLAVRVVACDGDKCAPRRLEATAHVVVSSSQ
jgi:hypothetical protein